MRLTGLVVAGLLVGEIACGGRKDEKKSNASASEGVAPDGGGVGSSHGASRCQNVTPKASAAVVATLDLLSGFDRARSEGFTYSTPFPTPPEEPTADPGATSFAASPAQADYKRQRADYDREVKRLIREREKYLAQFEKDWGYVELKSKQPPSQLATAMAPVPATAACRVVDVEGKCSKACFDTESYSPRTRGWPELVPGACSRPLPGYKWVHSCRAKITCEASPPLGSEKPALKYSSDVYAIQVIGKYVADEAGAAEFQKRIGAVRPCDVLRIPSIMSWRFRETWMGETTPTDGWPEPLTD